MDKLEGRLLNVENGTESYIPLTMLLSLCNININNNNNNNNNNNSYFFGVIVRVRVIFLTKLPHPDDHAKEITDTPGSNHLLSLCNIIINNNNNNNTCVTLLLTLGHTVLGRFQIKIQ